MLQHDLMSEHELVMQMAVVVVAVAVVVGSLLE